MLERGFALAGVVVLAQLDRLSLFIVVGVVNGGLVNFTLKKKLLFLSVHLDKL